MSVCMPVRPPTSKLDEKKKLGRMHSNGVERACARANIVGTAL